MEYKKSLFGKAIIDSSDSEEIKENEKIEIKLIKAQSIYVSRFSSLFWQKT